MGLRLGFYLLFFSLFLLGHNVIIGRYDRKSQRISLGAAAFGMFDSHWSGIK